MTMELQDARMSVIRVDQVFAASAEERPSGGVLSLVLFSGAVVTYTYLNQGQLLQDLQIIKEKMNLAPWVNPVPSTPLIPAFPDPYPVSPDPFPWNTPTQPWYRWGTTSDSSGVYQMAPEMTKDRETIPQ